MNKSADLQTVLLKHWKQYEQCHAPSGRQKQVMRHIASCRTPAMGSLRYSCSECTYVQSHYHACRDRHCPKCQRMVSRQWCDKQRQNLLPVTYYHVVFTLPSSLNSWVSQYPSCIYHALFQSAWHTLNTMGRDTKRLNGQVGATTVLHTWGENLSRHVHLHCLVPGGALSSDGRWRASKGNYLFPVRAMSRLFRGAMVSRLRQASSSGQLIGIAEQSITAVLNELMSQDWVVFSKPCPMKARSVVDYLGRYSHRIAISDQRIESITDGQVRFSMKDYRNEGQRRVIELSADEFIRRYLLHVLPKGLMRIRHYGFLANRCRVANLQKIRCAMVCEPVQATDAEETYTKLYRCPRCRTGSMNLIVVVAEERLAEA